MDCMVTKLLKEPGYTLFFDNFVPMRTYATFWASFISLAFMSALGEADDERDREDKEGIADSAQKWDRIAFQYSRAQCREIFKDMYNSDDFIDEHGDDDNDIRNFIDNINPFSSVVPGVLTWWQRRLLRGRPYDKNGEECGNAFMNLFTK